MFSHKDNAIDLNTEYPCPCHRKGMLKSITLTEAMGCDKCQQIFVVDETGEYLEQLVNVSPYPRKWRWNGKNWVLWRKAIPKSVLFFFLWFNLGIISILLTFAISSLILWILGIMMITFSIFIFLLLAYRY